MDSQRWLFRGDAVGVEVWMIQRSYPRRFGGAASPGKEQQVQRPKADKPGVLRPVWPGGAFLHRESRVEDEFGRRDHQVWV